MEYLEGFVHDLVWYRFSILVIVKEFDEVSYGSST